MKTFKCIFKIVLLLTVAAVLFESCAPRYSNGRYRPGKKRKCKCPAYTFNTNNNKQRIANYIDFDQTFNIKQTENEENI